MEFMKGKWMLGAVLLETRSGIDNIVSIPFARFLAGVHQRRSLLVDTPGLAVRIGFVLVVVENLHFVHALHKHAAVAASLAFADDFGRCAPLEVQLEVAEILFRADAAGIHYGRRSRQLSVG